MCYCIIIILLVHCLLLNINACIYLYDIQFAGGLTCMTLYDILSIYYHKPIVDQLNNKNTMPSTNHKQKSDANSNIVSAAKWVGSYINHGQAGQL